MRAFRIEKISIKIQKHRLTKPYVLSFGTISELDSIVVKLNFSDGTETEAETVPLEGYSDETTKSIVGYLDNVKSHLIGCEVAQARDLVSKAIEQTPFACSPLLTAIDLAEKPLPKTNTGSIHFVVPASSNDPASIKNILDSPDGFAATIKIKLSGLLNADMDCIAWLENTSLGNCRIRFDANKAFTLDAATSFYKRLSKSPILLHVDYVEQPLVENAWQEHAALVKNFPGVKTMLDESIVTIDDLNKAAAIKIPFVKFKLFKQGGIREMNDLINTAHQKGMNIVIGNGVSTAIGNEVENSIYAANRAKIFGASEANGFLKVSTTKLS